MPTDLSDHEQALFSSHALAADLAASVRHLRQMQAPNSEEALNMVVNTLMTEFWDQGFSQSEIRTAFIDALNDMNRYAAGAERR